MKINMVKMTKDLAEYYRKVRYYNYVYGNSRFASAWGLTYDTPRIIADVVGIVAKSIEDTDKKRTSV